MTAKQQIREALESCHVQYPLEGISQHCFSELKVSGALALLDECLVIPKGDVPDMPAYYSFLHDQCVESRAEWNTEVGKRIQRAMEEQ